MGQKQKAHKWRNNNIKQSEGNMSRMCYYSGLKIQNKKVVLLEYVKPYLENQGYIFISKKIFREQEMVQYVRDLGYIVIY